MTHLNEARRFQLTETTETKKTIARKYVVKKEDLIRCLGLHPSRVEEVKIYVEIPRGGDYSGSELEIDEETHLFIELKFAYTR